jgi:subtilase family serine protease
MTPSGRIRFYTTALLLIAGCCAVGFSQVPNRLVKPLLEDDVVTLRGNTHPMARPEFDQGAVRADLRMEKMMLHLQPSAAQQAELDALVEAQHDPQSPLYHQWLTPAQYGERFGLNASDLATVAAWLTSHGFTIDEIPAGKGLIVFSGTAGQVAETFHTEIHQYQVNGITHIANAQDPQIPAALAGVVGGVVSLHDFRRNSAIRTFKAMGPSKAGGLQPQYSSGSTHYLFPADWATIYDLNALYKAGTNGSGVSIAIVGRSNIVLSDVTNFRSAAALPVNPPQVILYQNINPGLVSGDQDESTLDVEWSGAVAPNATVKFVSAASTATSDGVDLSASYIVNNKVAPVMSTSYGSCESAMGSAELSFYNKLWQQAASEGISSFVSSGDSGAAGCYGGNSTTASGTGVNGLCSSPYSTCVGGTEFNEGSNYAQYWASSNGAGDESALSYIPEKVWNESASDGGSGLWSSGGGISITYPQPSWQANIPGTAAANGMRAVPDVAMTAAGHDGYIIYESPVGSPASSDGLYVIAGTSAASPSFAGVMALVVESKGNVGQGNANAGLYPLVNASKNPFHPTPSGNNSVPGVTGFSASGATYNLATGLGSVDGGLLVAAWGTGSATAATDFTLKASSASGTVQTGNSTTFTVSATESGTAKSTIALTAKAPTGVTVTFNPASITSTTSSTVTVAVGSTATAGAQSVTITGTDATGTQTASYALTVTQPPTLALSAAATSLTLNQGASGTVGMTATTGGSYTGNITFSATGLPSGVTASWSLNPITTAAGVSSSGETLTLTASSAAAAGTATVVITAAGDGLTATQSVSLKVVAAPALTLTPASTSLSVLPGASVTDLFSLAGNSTYSGAVTLSVTGLPANVTASWSSTPVTLANAAGSSTLTLKAASTAAAATTTLIVTASGDGLTVSKQVTLQVLPLPALAVTPATTALSVGLGGSVTDAIGLAGNTTYSGAVALSVTGLPANVTASWSSTPVTLANEAGSSTLTLKAASNAAVATTTLTVTATGDGLTVSKQITLQVLPPPALTATPAAAALSVAAGGSVTDAIALAGNVSYSGAVSLSATGMPTGVTASWSANPVTLTAQSGSSTLTLAAAASTAAGSYTVTVTATGDGLSVIQKIALTVSAPPALSISPASASMTVVNPVEATSTAQLTTSQVITLTGSSSFSGAVALSVTGLPAYLTASWSSSSVTLNASKTGTSTLTITATEGVSGGAVSTVTPGAYTATVTATGSGVTITKTIQVQVAGLVVTPAATTLTIHRGTTGTLAFTTASLGGASGVVVPGLSANAAPNGLTVSVNVASQPAPGNGTFIFTFAVSATATLQSYQLLPSTALLASATSTTPLIMGWSSSPVTLNIVQ